MAPQDKDNVQKLDPQTPPQTPKINWDDTDEIDHDWTTDDSPEGSEA